MSNNVWWCQVFVNSEECQGTPNNILENSRESARSLIEGCIVDIIKYKTVADV